MAEYTPKGTWTCLVTFALLASDVQQVEGFIPSSSSTATAAPATSSKYAELPGMRCAEQADFYPVGHVGGEWTEYLHRQAEKRCNKEPSCVGIMRYIGHDPVHCRYWCGRPQFCNSTQGASLNGLWLSYIKPEKVAALELQPGQDQGEVREAVCKDPIRISREKVVILAQLMPQLPFEDSSTCYVWWRRFSMGSPLAETLSAKVPSYLSKFSGELVENEHKGLVYLGSDSNFGFPRYHFDGNSLPAAPRSPKTKLMSIFFSSKDAVCYGADAERQAMTLYLADALFPGDVFAYDGHEDSLDEIFAPYQTTVFCGDFKSQRFPPPALVRAIALSTYPVVPLWMQGNLSRVQFHLPEAVQTYDPASLDLIQLHAWLEGLFVNPGDTASADLQRMFNEFANRALIYRYGEPVAQRAEAAACALCESRKRWKLRQLYSGALVAGPDGFADEAAYEEARNAAVEFALCSNSHRGHHLQRAAVRSTWASTLRDMPGVSLLFFVGLSAEGGSASELEAEPDVVQLDVKETSQTRSLQVFLMLEWAFDRYPHLQWLLCLEDDVYLRPRPIVEMLRGRAPVFYLWGKINRGTPIVRDPGHPDYNSLNQCPEQSDPVFGDAFPAFPDSALWIMSADLLNLVVRQWSEFLIAVGKVQVEELVGTLPPLPGPAIGLALLQVVAGGVSINMDDRYFNYFSSPPSCKPSSSIVHSRTWIFENVSTETMHCMWRLDDPSRSTMRLDGRMPDLCQCAPEGSDAELDSYNGLLAGTMYPKSRYPD